MSYNRNTKRESSESRHQSMFKNGGGEELQSPSQWSNSFRAGLCALIVEDHHQREIQEKKKEKKNTMKNVKAA